MYDLCPDCVKDHCCYCCSGWDSWLLIVGIGVYEFRGLMCWSLGKLQNGDDLIFILYLHDTRLAAEVEQQGDCSLQTRWAHDREKEDGVLMTRASDGMGVLSLLRVSEGMTCQWGRGARKRKRVRDWGRSGQNHGDRLDAAVAGREEQWEGSGQVRNEGCWVDRVGKELSRRNRRQFKRRIKERNLMRWIAVGRGDRHRHIKIIKYVYPIMTIIK